MSKSFLQRRLEKDPKYDIQATITGVPLPNGDVHMHVEVSGEDNLKRAANILQMAATVLRKKDDKTPESES